MIALHVIAWFLAGAFLANGVPHFVTGIVGRPFPSPFARPPGKGHSTPVVNVLWGFANFAAGLILLDTGAHGGAISPSGVATGAGCLLMALALAHHFGRHAQP